MPFILIPTDAAPPFRPFDAGTTRLSETQGPDRHLRIICACSDIAEFDPAAWTARRLGDRPMADFSDRLRCPCGRRTGRFEVWPGPMGRNGLPIRSAASLYD